MRAQRGANTVKVAAVIPAYNEEANIARVLRVLAPMEVIHEIIVVSDGSRDGTARVARGYPRVKVIELERNVGKGGAMMAGVRHTDADVILFLDADLIGLRRTHIKALLDPVLSGQVDMTLGLFDEGRLATDLAQRLAPQLSGQRAVRRELLDQVPGLDSSGFGVEMALTRYAEKHGARVARVPLRNVAQVMKEEKAGLWRGLCARARMYWEIIKVLR